MVTEKESSKKIRLQKYLAESGEGSRRGMVDVVREGRVTVNGVVVTEPSYKVESGRDVVKVGNRVVRPQKKGIMLFHKPRQVVSSLSDPEGRRCVGDILTKQYRSYFPVGRLDWDATGLMILTNDGDLADRLLHPRFNVARVYEAKVLGIPSDKIIAKVLRGVPLIDGRATAELEVLRIEGDSAWVRVAIGEGRNHLVKRLLEKVGHPVEKLRRVEHGPFKLGRLKVGEVHHLTDREYEEARRLVLKSLVPTKPAQTKKSPPRRTRTRITSKSDAPRRRQRAR